MDSDFDPTLMDDEELENYDVSSQKMIQAEDIDALDEDKEYDMVGGGFDFFGGGGMGWDGHALC